MKPHRQRVSRGKTFFDKDSSFFKGKGKLVLWKAMLKRQEFISLFAYLGRRTASNSTMQGWAARFMETQSTSCIIQFFSKKPLFQLNLKLPMSFANYVASFKPKIRRNRIKEQNSPSQQACFVVTHSSGDVQMFRCFLLSVFFLIFLISKKSIFRLPLKTVLDTQI